MKNVYEDGTKVTAINKEGKPVECVVVGWTFTLEANVDVYKLLEVGTNHIFYTTQQYVVERLS